MAMFHNYVNLPEGTSPILSVEIPLSIPVTQKGNIYDGRLHGKIPIRSLRSRFYGAFKQLNLDLTTVQVREGPFTMWAPLVISWFIASSNYGYNYHKS